MELDYAIIEEAVSASDAGEFDAVFLTGTSPKVLPVNSIDDNQFSVDHSCVTQLMAHYDLKIEAYLKSYRVS